MQYAYGQRQPARFSVGFVVVVLLHAAIVYALVTGLARKVVDVIQKPLETVIVEAPKPPPEAPPPPPPMPKMEVVPPPSYVPPPEVQIQVPQLQQQAPVITATQSTAPEAPPPVVAAVPPRPAPAPVQVGVACPNSQRLRQEVAYPREAQRQELEGETLVEFTLDKDGHVKDAQILKSSSRVFEAVSLATVRLFKCTAQAQDTKVQVPFVFRLNR